MIGYTIKPLGPLPGHLIAMQWGVIKDNPQPRDRDGGAYLVNLSIRGEYTCSCPHFRHRLRDSRTLCKHANWVRELWEAEQAQLRESLPETHQESPQKSEPERLELW